MGLMVHQQRAFLAYVVGVGLWDGEWVCNRCSFKNSSKVYGKGKYCTSCDGSGLTTTACVHGFNDGVSHCIHGYTSAHTII